MSAGEESLHGIDLPKPPQGWAWSTVEDLGTPDEQTVLTGPFGTGLGRRDFVATGVTVLTIGCLTDSGLDRGKAVFVKPAKAKDLDRYRLQHGDLLFSRMASVGRAGLVEREFEGSLFNYHLMRLRLREDCITPWLFVYFVRGADVVTKYIKHVNHGVTRDGINTKQLLGMPVLVPPRSEQTRIVEVIESYFTRLDNAVATLERVQANLKRYRASVLKAAVEGRLVPTEAELARQEGRDYEPASVLLERILKERRRRWEEAELTALKAKGKAPKDDKWKAKYKEPVAPDTSELPELPEGWCWATADQVSDPTRTVTYGVIKLGDETVGGVPTLRSSNVRHLHLDLSYVKPISPKIAAQYSRTSLRGGEILVTVRGTLGGVVVVPNSCAGFNVSREVAMIPLIDEHTGHCLALFIGTPRGQAWLTKNTRGITYRGINIESLKETPLPVPPIAEQIRIVAEVERLSSVENALDSALVKSEQRLSRLRQSILKWAFEGKLADQDPKDEPASAFLERIKAEREAKATEAKPKTRKKRNGRKRSAA